MPEIEITELDDIDPDSVHLVGKGANGFPALIAKAAAEETPANDQGEPGNTGGAINNEAAALAEAQRIAAGGMDYPDAVGFAKAIAEMTEHEPIQKAYGDVVKAKYSADDLKTMAGKGQAIPNDNGDPSYPIADEDDLEKAIKAVGRGNADHDSIRAHIIKRAKALKLSDKIPDNWGADGSITKAAEKVDCPTCKGDGKIMGGKRDCPDCDATGKVTAAKADTLTKADPGANVPDDDGVPGSQTWETADAARLTAATQSLLDLQCLLQTAAEREQIEGQTVDPDDLAQAWSLQDACYMLQSLLGVVAAMAVIEQREADKAGAMEADGVTKAGARLSAASKTHITTTLGKLSEAQSHLTDLLGEDNQVGKSGDDDQEVDVTKEELSKMLDDRDEALVAKLRDAVKPEEGTAGETGITVEKSGEELETTDSNTNEGLAAILKGAIDDGFKAAVAPLEERLETVEKMRAPSRARLSGAGTEGAGFIAVRGSMDADPELAPLVKQLDTETDVNEQARLRNEIAHIQLRRSFGG